MTWHEEWLVHRHWSLDFQWPFLAMPSRRRRHTPGKRGLPGWNFGFIHSFGLKASFCWAAERLVVTSGDYWMIGAMPWPSWGWRIWLDSWSPRGPRHHPELLAGGPVMMRTPTTQNLLMMRRDTATLVMKGQSPVTNSVSWKYWWLGLDMCGNLLQLLKFVWNEAPSNVHLRKRSRNKHKDKKKDKKSKKRDRNDDSEGSESGMIPE